MASNNASDVFFVDADNISILGLSVMGAGIDRAGIFLSGTLNCTVYNNEIIDNSLGIYIKDSMYNDVRNNTVAQGNLPQNKWIQYH